MLDYHTRTPINTFVGPAAAKKFADRGITVLAHLRTLSMADWWRIARADFNALARGAAIASVRPKGGEPIEQLLRHSLRNKLIFGLAQLGNDLAEAISAFLAAEGVTSLLLVSALNRRDLLEIPGMEPGYVDFLVNHLKSQNVRLAQR